MPVLGFRWPWEPVIEAILQPKKIVEAAIVEPAIVPITGVLAPIKALPTLLKIALGAGGGFLAAKLFGGGGSQEVAPEQITAVVPELTAEQKQIQDLEQTMRDLQAAQDAAATATAEVAPIITPVVSPITETSYQVEAGGGVEIGGVSTITTTPTTTTTTTITHAGVSQEAIGQIAGLLQAAKQEPQQITIVTPTQETTATQMDLGWVAIVAAAIIAAGMIFKGKR